MPKCRSHGAEGGKYGSHPNTFEVNKTGTVHIVDKKSGKVLIGQKLARAISTEHARQKMHPLRIG